MKWQYVEVDKNGIKTKGVLPALSEKEALDILQKEGKFVLSLKPLKDSVFLSHIVFNKDKIVADFTESLANMLSAGIPLVNSLEILFQEERTAYMKNVLKEMIVELKKGKSFYQTIMSFPLFPSLYSAMVRVGEETGKLKEVLKQLQSYTRKNVELRENILSSLYYPVFLMGLSMFTLFYLVLYVLPQLFEIFKGFDAKLPDMTIALMQTVSFVQNYFVWIIIFLFGIIFLIQRYMKTEKGRKAIEIGILKIPKAGELYRLLLNIDFFKPLSLMLKNKIHLNSALEILSQVVKSVVLQNLIENIIASLKKGEGIQMGEKGPLVFSNSTLQMLSIGDKSGKLSDIIAGIEERISEKSAQDIKRVLVLIEPIMILAIGLVIGFIVMSALLPIYSISTMAR
jgi:type IV pilus assembly protein PilC